MLDQVQSHEIQSGIRRLTNEELRTKVRANPWVEKRLAECGEMAQFTSLESLIDQRRKELIGNLAREEITTAERREFVELDTIRVQLMIPQRLRGSPQ